MSDSVNLFEHWSCYYFCNVQHGTYKLCLITYKAIHNSMPDYITDFCISAADFCISAAAIISEKCTSSIAVFHEV